MIREFSHQNSVSRIKKAMSADIPGPGSFGGPAAMALSFCEDSEDDEDDIEDTKVDEDENKSEPLVQLYELVWGITHLTYDNAANSDKHQTEMMDVLLLCFPLVADIDAISVLVCLAARLFSDDDDCNVSVLSEDIAKYISSVDHIKGGDRVLASFVVQVQVLEIIRKWVDAYWNQDWRENSVLIAWCKSFCERVLTHYATASGSPNLKQLERGKGMEIVNQLLLKIESMESRGAAEVSHLQPLSKGGMKSARSPKTRSRKSTTRKSRTLKGLTIASMLSSKVDDDEPKPPTLLLDADAAVLAEQITLMTMDYYGRIHPRECLKQAWKDKERKHERAPNILKCIDFSNALANWVQVSVLAAPNRRYRGKVIRQWIKVEEQLLEMHNFMALMAIYSGLESAPVHRLKNAWESAGKASKLKHERIRDLMKRDKNYRNLRSAQLEAHEPMVPYFGLFAQDMIQREERMERIDWNSLWMLKCAVYDFLSHQRTQYDFGRDAMVANWIMRELENAAQTDEDILYAVSTIRKNED